MILELHLLQNFAPSNLNRNDTGTPKDCFFGGVRRARISSQCTKRAIRELFRDEKLFPKSEDEKVKERREQFRENLGERTKRLAKQTFFEQFVFAGHSEEDSEKVAEVLLAGISIWLSDEKKTEYLLYFGNAEIRKFAQVGVDNFAELVAVYDEVQSIKADSKKDKKKKKSAIKKVVGEVIGKKTDVEKVFGKKLEDILDGGKAADIALFGRMLADLPERNVDAASQVANAISTHKTSVEFDFYTAVDTLKPDDIAGADMLGVLEFNSACYYRYSNVNIEKLVENLAGGKSVLENLKSENDDESKKMLKTLEEFAKITIEAFMWATIEAIPTGKQNWSATHERPDFILAVVQDSAKCSMANAFVKPIKEDEENDLIANSVEAFEKRWEKIARGYGDESSKILFNISNYDLTLSSFKDAQVESIENLINKTIARIFDEED